MPINHVNALPSGTRFEEYRLDAVLGSGGFGITYRAYDANLDKFVAIKEYLPNEFATRAERYTVVPQSSTDAQDYHWGLNRFLDEARTLARFDHPHLNKVYRFFESNGTAYMVLEYVEGETLANRLTRERQLPKAPLQQLLEEVLSGLSVMHEAGYVHRDIKPGNLMLREEDGSAVVLDFGAARQAVGQRSKAITSILTPGYAPIEQYDSQADDVGPWSDIYALGMVAYRCISGIGDSELPDAVTRGRTQRKGGVDLTSATEIGKGKYNAKLLEAIDWAMEVDEEDRPQTVGEWQRALAGDGRRKGPAKSVRRTATQSAKGATTKRTGSNWLGVAMTVVILALMGVSVWMASQLYPEWFKLGSGETLSVAQQEIPAEMPGETSQETEPGETEDALVGTEETPLSEGVSQTPPAITAAESGETVAEQPETELAKAPPAEEDEVTRLLSAAEADLKARRLTSPAGNNAWDRYQRVLEIDPTNPEAVQGMDRVIESYMELFGIAVSEEDFEQADSYLGRIRGLHPDSPFLLSGKKQLEDAKQKGAERLAEQERQRQAEEVARQAERQRQRIAQEIKSYWESFESTIQEEDLDRATDTLSQIRSLNPEEPGISAGEKRLETLQMKLERKRQETEKKMRQLTGEMIDVPGGTFRMGNMSDDGYDGEKPVHTVTVPAFRVGKYEVTVGQFRRFVEATGYLTDAERDADGIEGCESLNWSENLVWFAGRIWRDPGFSVGDDHPVVCVSWHDVEAFIDWLATQTGKAFRLPTEAEWEYAARAKSTTKYHFGNDESKLCRYGNHADTSTPTGYVWRNESCSDGVSLRTATVGSYQPNAFGLYDIHGNVEEWVQDCRNSSYEGAPIDGSAWILGDCRLRVFRGGSWRNGPRDQRSAGRNWSSLSYRSVLLGFRLAQDK